MQQRKTRAAITLIISLLPLWAVYFAVEPAGSRLSGAFLALHIALELIIWFCSSALFHLTASLAGGRGEAVGLFCAFGYVGLPHLYIIPAAALSQSLPAAFRVLLLAGAISGLTAWTAWLKVLALRECYGLSTAKSLLVFLMPLFVLIACAVFGAAVVGASVWSTAF